MRFSRRRSRTVSQIAGVVAALSLGAGLFTVLTPVLASAATVPTSDCRGFDPGLVDGICYQTGNGEKTWLGNYKNADGEKFFCIDKDKSSNLPANAPIHSTAGLKNQNGVEIGPRKVAALNFVVWKWGKTVNDQRAAAIELIIREVMSDTGGQLPSGLGIGDVVKAPSGGFPSEVLDLARSMWNEASSSYGPWNVTLAGDTATSMKAGDSRTYQAQITSGAGSAVDGETIALSYSGAVTGPATVTSGAGPVPVTITATGRGAFSVTASIVGPAANGKLFDPTDNGIQRGWIAVQQPDSASVQLGGQVFEDVPEITTETSDALVSPAAPFHDTVTISRSALSQTATANLYGPFTAQPGAADCTADKLATSVTFPVTGAGTYEAPDVTVTDFGYYTWTVSLPGDGVAEPGVTSTCGDVPETTLVNLQPQVTTQVSAQSSMAYDHLVDTIAVSGINGHAPAGGVSINWSLAGPLPVLNGACSGYSADDWAKAPIADSGTLTGITADGSIKTPATVVKTAGCYSYGETIPGTPQVQEYKHPAGQVPQTTLTKLGAPKVRTLTSEHVVSRGARLFDKVYVRDLAAGDTVTVTWTLYGPVKPRHGSCAKLPKRAWAHARVFATGSFVADHNGVYKTVKSPKLRKLGCYSYGESLPATESHAGYTHPVGLVSQTALVGHGIHINTGGEGFLRAVLNELVLTGTTN